MLSARRLLTTLCADMIENGKVLVSDDGRCFLLKPVCTDGNCLYRCVSCARCLSRRVCRTVDRICNDNNFTILRRPGGSALDKAVAIAETERAVALNTAVARSSDASQAIRLASGELWGGEVELFRVSRAKKCRVELFHYVELNKRTVVRSIGVYGSEGLKGYALWTKGGEGEGYERGADGYDRGHYELLKLLPARPAFLMRAPLSASLAAVSAASSAASAAVLNPAAAHLPVPAGLSSLLVRPPFVAPMPIVPSPLNAPALSVHSPLSAPAPSVHLHLSAPAPSVHPPLSASAVVLSTAVPSAAPSIPAAVPAVPAAPSVPLPAKPAPGSASAVLSLPAPAPADGAQSKPPPPASPQNKPAAPAQVVINAKPAPSVPSKPPAAPDQSKPASVVSREPPLDDNVAALLALWAEDAAERNKQSPSRVPAADAQVAAAQIARGSKVWTITGKEQAGPDGRTVGEVLHCKRPDGQFTVQTGDNVRLRNGREEAVVFVGYMRSGARPRYDVGLLAANEGHDFVDWMEAKHVVGSAGVCDAATVARITALGLKVSRWRFAAGLTALQLSKSPGSPSASVPAILPADVRRSGRKRVPPADFNKVIKIASLL
jgi:hypothetical protein